MPLWFSGNYSPSWHRSGLVHLRRLRPSPSGSCDDACVLAISTLPHRNAPWTARTALLVDRFHETNQSRAFPCPAKKIPCPAEKVPCAREENSLPPKTGNLLQVIGKAVSTQYETAESMPIPKKIP